MIKIKNKLVSVIIPTFNYGNYINDTFQSIIDQSYNLWECIIVDDGSEDNTAEIAEHFCSKDSRFKYHWQQNSGLSAARNKGLELASGEFIQFLDADDLIRPDKFRLQVEAFQLDPTIDVCYSDFLYFIKDGEFFKSHYDRIRIHDDPYKDFLFNWGFEFVIPIHSPLFRSSLFIEHGLRFNTDLRAREDWLIWLEISKSEHKFHFIDEPLAYYRKHDSSMVFDPDHMIRNNFVAFLEVYDSLSEDLKYQFRLRYAEYFSNLFEKFSTKKSSYIIKILHKIRKRIFG